MPITALSKDTIRILGSSQVLTTPVSLVKELIDNGLDARASAIDVSISANTLDKIEVRDNGQGIDSEDFNELGKRGHTSKLRAFEELRRLGGISLGFRGEALGSAVELGEVTVTTRTEGDTVATLLKMKSPDGVYSQSKTSGPVGTTVCVQNFLSRLPVRKQTALKEAAKTLSGIKELLKSYALARPHVKLSLKVLKSGKGSWSFSPRPHDGIKEVVSQVIGRELASQCVELTHTSPKVLPGEDASDSQETIATNSSRDATFEIHAFLPKANADITKISKGSFVSIDARPVSCKRGTLKKIISIYKEHLRASISNTSLDKLKDPFIRLNIVCPSGSYDPNVEPAKDDVLFENESSLLSLAHNLFEGFYGEIKANVATGRNGPLKSNSGFDLLMARKPAITASGSEASPTPRNALSTGPPSVAQLDQKSPKIIAAFAASKSAHSPGADISDELEVVEEDISTRDASGVNGKRQWGFSMAKDYGESEDQVPSPAASAMTPAPVESDPETESPRAMVSLNPWSIAKLNAPVRKRATGVAPEDAEMQRQSEDLPTPRQSSEPPSSRAVSVTAPGVTQHRPPTSSEDDLRNSYAAWVERHEKAPRVTTTPRVPPTPEERQYRSHSLPLQDDEDDQHSQITAAQHRSRARAEFVVARDLPLGDPWTPPPTQPVKRQRQIGASKPFKAPRRTGGFVAVNQEELIQPNGSPLHQSGHVGNGRRIPREDSSMSQPRERTTVPSDENRPHQDLQFSLDFEQRKEDAHRKQRMEARASASRPSPHQNRYNAAVAVLDSVSNNVAPGKEKNATPFKTSLPDGDPRAYLMRRQKSMSVIENHPERGVRLKRAKTMLLPLESTPENAQLHNVVGTISTNLYAICQAVVEVITEDEYLRSGMLGKAFDMDPSEVAAVKQWLVKESVERGMVTEGQDMEFDLSGFKKRG